MSEKETAPYEQPKETEEIIVSEPAGDYGEPSAYQGTTISKALHDYYSLTTNRDKVDVLKWIVTQPDFAELKRFSTAENKIFTLYEDQYNEILQTGELPNNLQIARKFVANGYDVFLLSNPKAIKSADFIIRLRNCLYYVEGKTSTGGSSLAHRFEKGVEQADRIALNFIGNYKNRNFITEIKNAFEDYSNINCLYVFKGSRLISVKRNEALSKTFALKFTKLWNAQK